MKKMLLSIVGLAALFAGGCVVESVYPFFTAKDVVFEPKLLGVWGDKDASEDSELWKFETLGDKAYWLTTTSKSETNRYEGYLFHLKEHTFLDLASTNHGNPGGIPTHFIMKFTQIEPTLTFQTMKYDWLEKLLEKNPNAIRHIAVHDEPGDREKRRIVLTADTKDLQAFILKYSSDTNAFTEPEEMARRTK